MSRPIFFFLFLSSLLTSSLAAQDTATDEVGQQASKLEAELGKFKLASPEAGNILVQLIDLYHANGRPFGLVRAGQRFVGAHPSDRRHQAVMLKLIDGLEALTRNKDLSSAIRQFLMRYASAPQCPDLEIRLAKTLDQMTDRPAAAQAYQTIWKRQGNAVVGRESGVRAIEVFAQAGGKENITSAAELAEQMHEKLPGQFATQVGWRGFNEWRRISEWAKSNLLGNKLVKKGIGNDKKLERELHWLMGSNYRSLGQHANAVVSLRKAHSLGGDRQDIHYYLIEALHNSQCKPNEIEPVVAEYTTRYADRADRFNRQSLVPHAYLRAENKPKALQLYTTLINDDAISYNNASAFVQNIGAEPADFAKAEQLLRAAIGKNQKHAYYLRYVLAFNVYRDRMKDKAKCKATLRELVDDPQVDGSYVTQAAQWLLDNAADDNEFNVDLKRILDSRSKHMHFISFRGFPAGWIKSKARIKELKDRAALVKAEVGKRDADPVAQLWLKTRGGYSSNEAKVRDELLAPNIVSKLQIDEIRWLLQLQGYYYRRYAGSNNRKISADRYGELARRHPDNFQYAVWYLQSATDYAEPEIKKHAALHIMKLDPQWLDADLWRRVMVAADVSKEKAFGQQALAWIQKSQQKFGTNTGYASYIGDVLTRLELAEDARKYWHANFLLDPQNVESRECANRLLQEMEEPQKMQALTVLIGNDTDFHGRYAQWLADIYFKQNDLNKFEKVLRDSRTRQDGRPMRGWDLEVGTLQSWLDSIRANQEASDEDKDRVYKIVRDMRLRYASAAAEMAILEKTPPDSMAPMQWLLVHQGPTRITGNESYDWDRLVPYAQGAIQRKDYVAAATLVTGMLANISNAGEPRFKAGRAMISQCYSRMGSVGLTIDENSPIAPLLQAALYLRLGDENLAFDTYHENRALFNEHRNEIPTDLLTFVCERLIAASGDENHDLVEETLRGWLVQFSESTQHTPEVKAQIQLLLARNYFGAQRYDVARSEFTTVMNRYPETLQAVEAEFGIAETFMSQKVYDQAEQVFEKLANSQDASVVIRAEFLRGVLAFRRGDNDDARGIFRAVLERVPDVELANKALFNLSEVYGIEEKYLDQLNLLRTVGRLGSVSKRLHSPGLPLSVVVHDSDLGISRGHSRIAVIVTTQPGGDKETIFLTSSGAGKGLFRADLETALGGAAQGDKVLQLTGNDVIKSDYPDEFKADFKNVPLSDVEIRVASSAVFEVSSSQIVDAEEETFSQRLERETREQEEADQRVSQDRPVNQIKPGNPVYLRVKDGDRDLTNDADMVVVKLAADNGDEVQARLKETGPHTGIFEGSIMSDELPAGALASDTSIEYSPLMAIDRDEKTTWLSEPNGATPKMLTIDMKDLKLVSKVRIHTPNPDENAPVRGTLLGSNDGEFWFRLSGHPELPVATPIVDEPFGQMKRRVYNGNVYSYTTWSQIVSLSKNSAPIDEEECEELTWTRPEEEGQKKAFGVIWHGKFVQPRDGAVRFLVQGYTTALGINGRLELPVARGNRTVDVWLDAGAHDLVIFSAASAGSQVAEAKVARADLNSEQVQLVPFRESDFDLTDAVVKAETTTGETAEAEENPPERTVIDNVWEFNFTPREVRHVRFVIDEYLGEAVAINHFEISDGGSVPYIPTESDVLSLAGNDTLEIAGGDVVTATYTDEFTMTESGNSQLLSEELTATYYNAEVAPIAYDFSRSRGGGVATTRKELLRIDPGERIIFEIVDYDEDTTAERDTIKFEVMVNDGDSIELEAAETDAFTGIFTKEVDTTKGNEDGKLSIKQGDRIYCRYRDTQNTFPGHSVPRETVVYVNEPTEGVVKILPSRVEMPPEGSRATPQFIYLEPIEGEASGVALEAPITVEVIDPDQAKDSRSSVIVKLQTSDGATVDVKCEISEAFADDLPVVENPALLEGRFVGQIIMQLGGKDSADIIPLTLEMPRNLIGEPVMDEEDEGDGLRNLVTRVLNLTGKDMITATYNDELRPSGSPIDREASGRMIVDGTLACTDPEYVDPIEKLHVGERMYLKVVDADRDASDERDAVSVEITTDTGEKEAYELVETLAHSGIFTGSIILKASDEPTPGNLNVDEPSAECYFGDTIKLRYVDETASTDSGTLELTQDVPVVIGTNGLLMAFTKTFDDENLAVETKFHIAESYFELFKSHKDLGRDEDQKLDLESGRRVLREVMEDYPDPKYAPRIAYLLGQFAQELQQWDEAIKSYELIIRQYSDHALAADAQYKLAQTYEEAGDFDEALEGYVTLAATYPKSPLIASVMIRIADHFYKAEEYDIAAQVGEKFMEKFEGHEHAPRLAFRVGQCHYKAEDFRTAAESFDVFAKKFPDDELCSQALFWSGESYRMARNTQVAFQRYNRCRWDFPASEAARFARGRLTLPEMIQQFEAALQELDDN